MTQDNPRMGDLNELVERLLARYWDFAYAEGREGRSHDTPAGDAQETLSAIRAALTSLIAERDGLRELADRLKLEAQCHAGEARGANHTIYEIYQVLSGGKGEPGNWNGAEPARQYVAKTEAQLKAAREQHSWPPEAQFQYGDWVEKFTGEALWEGRVVSAYHTKRLALRYVVEVEPQGFQMIAVPAQLRTALSLDSNKGDGKP